jgi:hypothetical protein
MMESNNSSLADFAWQRAMFHNVCPDARAFIAQGLQFLKRGLLAPGSQGFAPPQNHSAA